MELLNAQTEGIKIFGPITIPVSGSSYGTHFSHFGTGGFVELPNIQYRNSIPISEEMNADGISSGRRKLGMIVYTIEENRYFQLVPLSGSNKITYNEWLSATDAQRMVWLDPTASREDLTTFDLVTGTNNPDDCWTELFFNNISVGGNYLPLSGGTVTGDVTVNGTLFVDGTATYINSTNLTISDPLIFLAKDNPANLVDIGLIGQFINSPTQYTGLVRDHDIGEWRLFSGLTGIPVTATDLDFTDLKLKVDTLNSNLKGDLLTSTNVFGFLSSNDVVYALGGNSIAWNSVFTTVSANSATWGGAIANLGALSANWQSNYSTTSALSSNWNSVFTTVSANSANWQSNYSTTSALSSNWNSVFTTVSANSATWNYQGADLKALSANWQSNYSTTSALSSNWNSVFTTVSANSATWQSNYSTTSALSSNWNSVFTTVSANSATWGDGNSYTLLARIKNADSVPLVRGNVVYTFGSTGNVMSVKLASNLSEATSSKTLGFVNEVSISPNGSGTVTLAGSMDGLTLGAFSEGDALWLNSTPGNYTNVKPVAPNHGVYLGVVERANNGNGIAYVKIQNGYELNEIHDVLITSPLSGQILRRNSSNNLWQNVDDAFNWDSTYTTVSSNSASRWDNNLVTSYVNNSFLPLSGGTLTSNLTVVGSISATDYIFKRIKINLVTSDYTFQAGDQNSMVLFNSTNAVSAIIPSDTTYSFASGTEVNFTSLGTGLVYVVGESPVNIRAADGRNYLRTTNSTATILKLSANDWLLFGDIWSDTL